MGQMTVFDAQIQVLDISNEFKVGYQPRSGVYTKDTTLGHMPESDAQIQVLDIPNELGVGYQLLEGKPVGVH